MAKRENKYSKVTRLEREYNSAKDARHAARMANDQEAFKKADKLCAGLYGELVAAKQAIGERI